MPFSLGMVWAVLCTDALQSLEYQTRPYEVDAGQTEPSVQEASIIFARCSAIGPTREKNGGRWSGT